MIAPEQGRSPTATIAEKASLRLKFSPPSDCGEGMWAWPHSSQKSATDVLFVFEEPSRAVRLGGVAGSG